MNSKNLKPINNRIDFKEVSSKGGKKSGKVRGTYKTFREALQSRLCEDNLQEELVASIIEQAKSGNVRAFEVICDRTDGKPRQAIDFANDNKIEIIIGDDLKEYAN